MRDEVLVRGARGTQVWAGAVAHHVHFRLVGVLANPDEIVANPMVSSLDIRGPRPGDALATRTSMATKSDSSRGLTYTVASSDVGLPSLASSSRGIRLSLTVGQGPDLRWLCRENFPYSFKSRLRRLAACVLASLRAPPPQGDTVQPWLRQGVDS
jgi:hypothetical protein